MRGKSPIWASLISLLIISVAMVGTVSAPVSTKVYIDPPTSTAPPGETFIINVNVADVPVETGASTWEFKLSWDPDILYTEVGWITEGDFLKSVGSTYFVASVSELLGRMGVGCVLKVPVTASGSGCLATIEFQAKAEGECPLALFDTKLLDIDLAEIPHTEEDGYFSNIVIGDAVRRSAWPEHHHFSISKDEDGVQTLYGKVKNLGDGDGYVRVNFTVVNSTGELMGTFIAKHMVGDEETRIAPGDIVVLSVNLWGTREEAWKTGKYYASAMCLYSGTGVDWKMGIKVKTFSFAIVL